MRLCCSCTVPARGQVSGQILLRNTEDFVLNGVTAVFDSEMPFSVQLNLQGYPVYNDGVPYPVRVLKLRECKVLANRTQGLLLTVNTPENAQSEIYSFKIAVETSCGEFTVTVQLRIHNVVIPSPAQADLDHEYFFDILSLEPFYPTCTLASPQWWNVMEKLAVTMKELRINVLSLNVAYLSRSK